jgi:hypothetical protein
MLKLSTGETIISRLLENILVGKLGTKVSKHG